MAERHPIQFVKHPVQFPQRMTYRATCCYVVDGDTIDVFVDMGLNKYAYETLRLKDVNAREIHGGTEQTKLAAQLDKLFTSDKVLDKPVLIETYKDTQTFGRYVANVWYWDAAGVKHSLNDELRQYVDTNPVTS